MKVLLVEDDQYKADKLKDFLESKFSDDLLVIARSISRAIEAIDESPFKWVFLDMSLPMYEIGRERPRAFGGKAILQYLNNLDRKESVVVVTQFQTIGEGKDLVDLTTLQRQLSEEFPVQFRGLIFFSEKSDSWKSDIETLVEDF